MSQALQTIEHGPEVFDRDGELYTTLRVDIDIRSITTSTLDHEGRLHVGASHAGVTVEIIVGSSLDPVVTDEDHEDAHATALDYLRRKLTATGSVVTP